MTIRCGGLERVFADRIAGKVVAMLAVVCVLGVVFAIVAGLYNQSAKSEIQARILEQQAFAEHFQQLDHLLERGGVIGHFHEELARPEFGDFQRLQQQLREAEQSLSALRDAGADPAATTTLGALLSLYGGYRIGESAEFPLNPRLDQQAVNDSLMLLQQQNTDAVLNTEIALSAALNRQFWLLGVLVLMALAGLVAVPLLISKRRRVMALDKALHEERQRCQRMLAAIPGAVLIADDMGKLCAVSDSASQLLGFDREELTQRDIESLISPRFQPQYQRLLRNVRDAEGKAEGQELMMVSHSGSDVPVELMLSWFDAGPMGPRLLVTLRDVGDQYLLHEQFLYSQQRFDLAVMASRDGIWDWDMRADKLYLSPGWLAMVGIGGNVEESDTKRVLLSCIPEPEQRKLKKIMKDFLRSKSLLFTCEHQLQRRDGAIVDVSCRAAVKRDADGRAIRMVGVHGDITAAKTTTRQLAADKHSVEDRLRLMSMKLEAAEAEAEQANKARSAFLSVVGHEFRTPMNAVVGMTDLLLRSPLNSEQKLMLDTIGRSSQSLLAILDRVLDYSMLETGSVTLQVEQIMLQDYLEGVLLGLADEVMGNGQQLILNLDPCMPERICLDPLRVRQLLIALLENAIKFSAQSKPRGEIELLARPVNESEKHQHGWAAVAFEIRDNGVGIPEEIGRDMFRPFVQAESSHSRRFGGVGLGLAVAEKLVSLMEGEISVDAAEQQGSCFKVLLPIDGFEEREDSETALPDHDASHLWVVINNDTLRLAVSAALGRKEWRARYATHIDTVKLNPAAKTLIVSDAVNALPEALEQESVKLISLQLCPAGGPVTAPPGVVYINPLLPSRLCGEVQRLLNAG